LVDQDSAFRARTVRLTAGGKEVLTPIRALDLKDGRTESRIIDNPSIRGLNEVYSNVTPALLDEIDNDAEKQAAFIRGLQQGVDKINFRSEINLFVFVFDGAGRSPTDQQIDYLTNLVTGSPYNDAVLTPLLRGVSGDDYAAYLRKFFERLRSYTDSETIMGSIPHIAHIELDPILQTYIENGVRLFALDLDGKDPLILYPNINTVFRAMRTIEHDLSGEDCCYLHGINMKRPRGIEKKQVTPAKDILVYEMGFNSFGSSHIKPKFFLNPQPPKNVAWVLNRSDYGYYATSSPHAREITHDSDVSIKLADVVSDATPNIRRRARLFNVEQQGLEALTIQSRIRSQELETYLREKEQVVDSLKRIRKKMPLFTLN
jgi:hypothetical protein